ncbi:MAG: hypothetical protein IT168_12405 [Bryobacterales bacterium]|nr:hypothetical protein [Bryobacterales bacterium]
MRIAPLTAVLFSSIATLTAQPNITAWQPNYSFTLPGTPHYAAAQGSLIVIYGDNLGPAQLLSQGFHPALDRNLGGVSVRITVGTTTTQAIPYYVSARQIAAIVPSTTPLGDGTLTVTYNSATSATFPIRIVQSAVGLLTRNGYGVGPAAVYDSSGRLITRTNAANPGDTVVFWGTGVGPDLTTDETRLISAVRNLENLPFEFHIGGKLATAAYRGRSTYPGVDQINVIVPQGVSGCAVSAYAKTGAFVSNITTVPIALTGNICSDNKGFSAEQISRFETQTGWILSASASVGRTANWRGGPWFTVPPGTIHDEARLEFQITIDQDRQAPVVLQPPSIGSCVVGAGDDRPSSAGRVVFHPVDGVTLKLPDGTSRPMTGPNPYTYSEFGPAGSEPLIPNVGALFQIDTVGGTSSAPFTTTLTALPTLQWTNKSQLAEIDRTRPLDLTWIGAPQTYAVISGYAANGPDPFLWSTFYCTAPGDTGRFTVPADILSHMLKSLTANDAGDPVQSGQLTLTLYSIPNFQTVQGLDFVESSSYSSEILRVNFK